MPTASVVGGSGYIGQELLRIVAQHPEIELKTVTSRQNDGQKISKMLPHLAGFVHGSFTGDLSRAGDADIVFVSTPHGASFPLVKQFLSQGCKVIELGGDYRFKDEKTYEKWYGHKHEDLANLKKAVYGLPEINRTSIKKADLVANPGCYATASILGLAPAAKANLLSSSSPLIVDAKSGVSGAGKEASEFTHFPNVSGNVLPYKVGKHRHAPEIQTVLASVGNSSPHVIFTPHLVPVVRGILTTIYAPIGDGVGLSEIQKAYASLYSGCAFVRLQEETPTMQQVVGSNVCAISAQVVEPVGGGPAQLIVVSSIDNLVKGGAGQAVQNANLMLGLKEEAGLLSPALGI